MKLRGWITISAALVLAGCTSIPLGPFGAAKIQSSPAANAMRTCAALSDVVTPGISPAAVATLTRGILGKPLALGNTPQGALRNCANIIDIIND